MVRNYKRKKEKINADTLLLAVQAVIGGMSMRSASIKFEVPRTTLIKHYRNNSPIKAEITKPESSTTSIASAQSSKSSVTTKSAVTQSHRVLSAQQIEIKSGNRTKVCFEVFVYWPFQFICLFDVFLDFHRRARRHTRKILLEYFNP